MITKAIIKHESGGDCKAKGKSGEEGCMQFLDGTWKLYSKQVLGYVAPLTEINEKYVGVHTVQRLLNEGKNLEQIALAWNAGENAKKCSSGTNKKGVKYNSCEYVKAVKVAYNLVNVAEADE